MDDLFDWLAWIDCGGECGIIWTFFLDSEQRKGKSSHSFNNNYNNNA